MLPEKVSLDSNALLLTCEKQADAMMSYLREFDLRLAPNMGVGFCIYPTSVSEQLRFQQ
jgi:hypothetical protein